MSKPVILIGSPNNPQWTGDGASNGGVKAQNLWSLLLRANGYESYFVSYDGSKIDWLIEHTEYISVETARQWRDAGRRLKFLTTWLWSASFFELAKQYYLFDQELSMTYTYAHQRGILEQHLAAGRILKLGVHTRTMQAYYNAVYGLLPTLIEEWSADYWIECPERRISQRIGFMDESPTTQAEIALIQERCVEAGFTPEFVPISGCEAQVLAGMQSCDLFLGMNQGKSEQWGEGCPRSPHEAMLAGCVVVAYDVLGNGQYVHDPGTGALVPRQQPERMAERVIEYLRDTDLKEQTRARSLSFMNGSFRTAGKFRQVAEFLDLDA